MKIYKMSAVRGIKRSYIITFVLILFLIVVLDQIYLQYQLSITVLSPYVAHSLHLDDVRQLMRASSDADVPVTLFDPTIIEAYHYNAAVVTNPTACVFLCHVVGPLLFSAKFKDVDDKPMFLTRLAHLGFTVTQFSNSEGQRTHIFLLRKGSPLHVVLLHWSEAGYYRQYQVVGSSQRISKLKQYITKDTWRTLSSDRAYKSFSTKEVLMDAVKLNIPSDVKGFIRMHHNAKFLACNFTRANYFRQKYPGDAGKNVADKGFVHKAYKILDTARAVLDANNITFWLSSGTLLGYYRQCEIFPWAEDVDIGVFIEDFSDSIIPSLERRGLKLKHKFGKISDSFELSFELNNIKLDIFFFYTDGALMWNGGCNKRGDKFKYIFPAFTLCWTEFLGMLVRIPCNTEEYIVANYGPNWFTPQRRWSYTDSPPNVIPNGHWNEEEWSEVMQVLS